MAVTPYRAVSFTPHEVIGGPKLTQFASNQQWLFEYTPRVLYTDGLVTRAEGVRLASGKVRFTKRNSDSANIQVSFGNFFSTHCRPNITTGIYSNHSRKISAVVYGIGTLQPDHRGFHIGVEIMASKKTNDKILDNFWVSWQAMGY